MRVNYPIKTALVEFQNNSVFDMITKLINFVSHGFPVKLRLMDCKFE